MGLIFKADWLSRIGIWFGSEAYYGYCGDLFDQTISFIVHSIRIKGRPQEATNKNDKMTDTTMTDTTSPY